MIVLLSWIGTGASITGAYLAAKKNKWCWWWFMLGSILWTVVSIAKHDWPLFITNLAFLIVNIYGLWNWRK